MRVLLISMVLYLLGIAVLLYLRPALMFHKDGRWKEFGVGSDETTVFPFWMFCIGWAVISYGIGRLFFKEGAVNIVKNASAISALATGKSLTEDLVEPIGVSGPAPAEQMTKPGYYKLNSAVLRKKGAPRYIYMGTDVPSDLEESS
jgi:hypothetical protein